MPGKKGIDTRTERDFLEYNPDITRTRERVVSDDVENRTKPLKELQPDDISFIDDLKIIDQKIIDLRTLLDDQQALLALTIDADARPDVKEALDYFLGLNDVFKTLSDASFASRSTPTITFPVYIHAYDTLRDGVMRNIGGEAFAIGSTDETNALTSQIKAFDNARVLQLAAYWILGIVLDFVGKKVIPGFPPPLNKLKDKFKSWAKKMINSAISKQPAEPSLGIREKDDEGNILHNEEPFSAEDGLYGLISRDGTSPPSTPKPIAPVEALGHAERIITFVHERARQGKTPGANPSAFYVRPMYDMAYDTHISTKVLVQVTGMGSVESKTTLQDNAQKFFDIISLQDLKFRSGFIGGDIRRYSELLGDSQSEHSLSASTVYQAVKGYGQDTFIRLLDSMQGMLRYWYTSPDAVCCFITFMGQLGTIDKSVLYTMRGILLYLIGKEADKTQFVLDPISEILNMLVLALSSRVGAVLDSIFQRAILKVNRIIDLVQDEDVVSNCSPLDDLLAILAGAVLTINIEISGLVQSLIADFGLRDGKLERTTGDLEKKQRLERFLRIVNVIINALETGELCQNTQDRTVPVPAPTIDEIERFLAQGLLPEFEESQRSRDFIIEKYGRDPLTGQTVGSISASNLLTDTAEIIRKTIDGCGDAINDRTLEQIIKRVRDRGNL